MQARPAVTDHPLEPQPSSLAVFHNAIQSVYELQGFIRLAHLAPHLPLKKEKFKKEKNKEKGNQTPISSSNPPENSSSTGTYHMPYPLLSAMSCF
jgi:hypothetical protein